MNEIYNDFEALNELEGSTNKNLKKMRSSMWKPYIMNVFEVNDDNADYYDLSDELFNPPEYLGRKGATSRYKVKRTDWAEHRERFLKCIAMYTLSIFAQSDKNQHYMKHFYNGKAIMFNRDMLIKYCFYGIPMVGNIYGVKSDKIHEKLITDMYGELANIESSVELGPYTTGTLDRWDYPIGDLYYNEKKCDEKSHKNISKKLLKYPAHYHAATQKKEGFEVCIDATNAESDDEMLDCTAHHCFGDCGVDRNDEYDEVNKMIVNNRIFDFDKFILNVQKTSKGTYTVSFDDKSIQEFHHASYSDNVKAISFVNTIKLGHASYVDSLKIKVTEKSDEYIYLSSTYYGVDVL